MKSKVVLQDALSLNVAYEVRDAFLNADYDRITQERRGYYAREFNSSNSYFPGHDEVYTAEFYRSKYLESSELINNTFETLIKPIVEKELEVSIASKDLRVYKMLSGGHFRLHKDDYLSKYGFIWYLSREWKWDWGGLLLDISSDGTAEITMPRFNQLVLMNHANGLIPHCVTEVTKYAKEPRLMLVGFLS